MSETKVGPEEECGTSHTKAKVVAMGNWMLDCGGEMGGWTGEGKWDVL